MRPLGDAAYPFYSDISDYEARIAVDAPTTGD
jgi:hypothetical protein